MSEICGQHGRLRCGECAYIEELKEIIDGLAKERHDLINECDKLKDTVFLAVKALEWYANQKNWNLGVEITLGSAFPKHEAIKSDKGERAKTALEEIKRLGEGVNK